MSSLYDPSGLHSGLISDDGGGQYPLGIFANGAGGDLSGMLDENGMLNMDMGMAGDLSGMDMDMGGGPDGAGNGFEADGGGVAARAQDPHMVAATVEQAQQGDVAMSGAGAGPLPAGFGMPAQTNGSTLTEFTKRRNWSQRIIEELKDLLHILTPDGRILYVSPSCRSITGHEPNALVGKFIGEFVHPDDSGIFMREFNESIATGNALRFFYRFKKDDGTYMIFECDGHPHISPDQPALMAGMAPELPQGAGMCRGFFMMARPYPTKNAALLDSFLEHKIENERLMKRIDELKREEAEETAEQDRLYREQISPQTAGGQRTTPSDHQRASAENAQSPDGGATDSAPNYQGMPPPAKPGVSNTALTRQNLDSALSAQKPDSIADKMSRYEASSTHLESIELLTGLRYRDGERSHGISTGDTSPALIRGDAGIAILLDRDREGGKKDRKKQKVADEYVCADCGTLDSPEWRKGPKGPKTLCNACGLRWAKKEKKRTGDDGGNGGGKNESPVAVHGQSGGGGGVPSLQKQGSHGSSVATGMTGQSPVHGGQGPGPP